MTVSKQRKYRHKSRAMTRAAAVSGALAITAISMPAAAQELSDGTLNVGSRQSEFAPLSIRIGTFDVFPQIDADIEYNDNIFASRDLAQDDVIVSIIPSLIAEDRRPDREIRLGLTAGVDKYLSGTFNDQFRGRANARARLGLDTATRPFFGFEVGRNNSRGLDGDDDLRLIAQPVTVTTLRSNAGVERDFGPLTALLEGTAQSYSYDGDLVIDDQLVDVGFRDNRSYTGRAQVAFSRSDNQRFFVELIYNDQNFDDVSNIPGLEDTFLLDRTSNGYRLQAGYLRKLTNLLTLNLRAGYLRQSFRSERIGVISGISFEGALDWRPTPLTRVNARALRAIDQSVNPLLTGALRTEVSARVDHELLRNVTLFASGRYAWIDQNLEFQNITENNLRAGARYRLNRNWSVSGEVERFERNNLFDFTQNRAIASVRYNF